MFNQDKFSNILSKINSTYNTMTEFGQKASFDRTYISKYINKKLENPPTPKILEKIASASNGITTYENLMVICGYSNASFYMCPVYGQISAGQPNWAEENIEGRIPIDTNLINIVNPEEHFFLRVNR